MMFLLFTKKLQLNMLSVNSQSPVLLSNSRKPGKERRGTRKWMLKFEDEFQKKIRSSFVIASSCSFWRYIVHVNLVSLVQCGSIARIAPSTLHTTDSTGIRPQIRSKFEITSRTVVAIDRDQVLEIGDAMHDLQNWSMPKNDSPAALGDPLSCP